MKRSLLFLALLSASAACANQVTLAPAAALDLAQVTDGRPVRGISARADGAAGFDVVVDTHGLLTLDVDGALVTRRAPGEGGLWNVRYNDVARMPIGDDRFVLLADNEGYLFDAQSGEQRVHFCVEPGFVDDPLAPQGPVITQRNDAVALTEGRIVAAPRFYEDGNLRDSVLNTYDIATGAPVTSVPLDGLELAGLALEDDGARMWGVQRNELVALDDNGAVLERFTLSQTVDASGVAVVDGVFVVTDVTSTKAQLYSP